MLSLETEPVIKDESGINSVDKYRPFALASILFKNPAKKGLTCLFSELIISFKRKHGTDVCI